MKRKKARKPVKRKPVEKDLIKLKREQDLQRERVKMKERIIQFWTYRLDLLERKRKEAENEKS